MATTRGDFILLEYTAKAKETNEIFDTSSADAAKEAKIHREDQQYEPLLVVIGEGWVLKSLDEQLVGLEADKKTTIEIPSDKAFGPRDPNKIRLIPLRQFTSRNINPTLGLEVEVENRRGIVRSVGAGRVTVDFNPALAGRTLIYDVEVKKIIHAMDDKIRALIHRNIPMVSVDKFSFTIENSSLRVTMPEETLFIEGTQLAKRSIALQTLKFMPEIKAVEFLERYERKEI